MKDRIREDVTMEAAAMAHGEAFETDKRAALALGCSRRSANRYRHEGPPVLHHFGDYAMASPHPERIVAFAQSLLRRYVRGLTRDQLIGRYREALLAEPGHEATDRLHQVDGSSWLVRAQASQADAGVDELKGAIELEFEARFRRDPRSYATDAIMAEVLHG